MSERELAEQEQLIANNDVFMAQTTDVDMHYEDVVHGRWPVDISHAGGEMEVMGEDFFLYPKCVYLLFPF